MVSLETLSKTSAQPVPPLNFQGQSLEVIAVMVLGRVRHFKKDGERYLYLTEELTIGKLRAGFQLEETLQLNGIESDFDRWVINDFDEQQRRIAAARAAWRAAVAKGDPNDIVNIVTHLGQPMSQVSSGGKPLDVVVVAHKERYDKYEWNGQAYCLSMPKRTTDLRLTWGKFYAGFKKE